MAKLRMKVFALKWYDEAKLYSEGGEVPLFATRKEAIERANDAPVDDLAPRGKKKPKIVAGEANFDLS